jgi:hypothetical protein
MAAAAVLSVLRAPAVARSAAGRRAAKRLSLSIAAALMVN